MSGFLAGWVSDQLCAMRTTSFQALEVLRLPPMVKSPGELKWPLADPGEAGLYDGLLQICTRR
ncbi:MAG: hypothetical protein VB853_02445, partial [Pirellulales bacterium]